MQERLVVGFDGSESALTAMRWAAAEADGRQASVRVVGSYAMPPIMEYYGIGSSDATPAEKEQLAQACRSGVTKAIDACRDVHPNVGFDSRSSMISRATRSCVRPKMPTWWLSVAAG